MRPQPLLPLLALAVISALPVSAKVLAEGKPSKGLYWQKIEQSDGSTQYLCRSQSDAKIQKGALCSGAGAQKPQ